MAEQGTEIETLSAEQIEGLEKETLAEVKIRLLKEGGILFTDKDEKILDAEVFHDMYIDMAISRAKEVVDTMKKNNEIVQIVTKTVDEMFGQMIKNKQSTEKDIKITK